FPTGFESGDVFLAGLRAKTSHSGEWFIINALIDLQVLDVVGIGSSPGSFERSTITLAPELEILDFNHLWCGAIFSSIILIPPTSGRTTGFGIIPGHKPGIVAPGGTKTVLAFLVAKTHSPIVIIGTFQEIL